MTESQSPSSSNSVTARNLPPLPPPPPPPPSLITQRQHTQTLDMSAVNRSVNPTPPPPPNAAYRPGTPPPISTPDNDSPLTLAQIIREAFDNGYSDIHLGVGEIPRFRNRGEINPSDYPETDKETFMSWLREIMTEPEIQRFQEHLEFDGATQYEFARVRINVFDSLKGYAMVLRLIPLKILSIDQLRLPSVFRDICHYHKGLILVTGPTGSGKSTTMAAMIDYINREMPKHIITIEDPIEFVHSPIRAPSLQARCAPAYRLPAGTQPDH